MDGAEQRVEVWTPEAELPVIEAERLVWQPANAPHAFTFELCVLFTPV